MMLLISFLILTVLLVLAVLFLFFFASSKTFLESLSSSAFECGFSSYFFSRFSFSIHYFTVGLIFLFLDLELCYLMPFFQEGFASIKPALLSGVFIIVLIWGLLEEWKSGMLEWKF